MRALLVLLLLFPFLIWILKVPVWNPHLDADSLKSLASSTVQAAASSLLSLFAGWGMFLALQAWSKRRDVAEFALLLPNMMPPLFLILGLMNLVSPFPYGLPAVIVAHVVLNSGLVAIALDGLIHNKLGGIAEASWLMGASRGQFWRKVAWPYLKADIACLYLFVFSICFTSFSIPLILGGDRAGTLEVAIFDAIRVEGKWDKALILAAMQAAVLFALAMLLPQGFWPTRASKRPLSFLALPKIKLIVFLPVLVLAVGWCTGLVQGLGMLRHLEIYSLIFAAALTTLAVALGVGLLHLAIFLAIAFVSPHRRMTRFLNGYLSPSPVITGFAFLLLPGESEAWRIVKLIVALTLISLPLLYRWIVHTSLASVSGQIRLARTLGASWHMILFEVVWPQVSPQIMRACGLAGLWASGDFALSSILAESVETLPLLIEGLIGNYRLETAQVLMLPLMAIGLGVYFLFVKMGRYVAR